MRRNIGLKEARTIMLRRRELLDRGLTERRIRSAVESGRLVVVRRGWYVGGDTWSALWPEGRHLLAVLAVHRDAVGGGPVFCGVSAAVLLGLPLYRTEESRVHVAARRATTRSAAGVLRHETALEEADLVEIDGLLCTSPERTVLDLGRTLAPEAAVAAADAVLRREAVHGLRYDEERAERWRERLLVRAAGSSSRGIRQARRVIAFAEGRAESPGESVSRLQLRRLGFRRMELQVPILLPDGTRYWIDFGLDDVDAWGEFDGAVKYLDPGVRKGRSAEEVVLDEKRREDLIRGFTGRRFVRWEEAHIRTPSALGKRLSEFGLRAPEC